MALDDFYCTSAIRPLGAVTKGLGAIVFGLMRYPANPERLFMLFREL